MCLLLLCFAEESCLYLMLWQDLYLLYFQITVYAWFFCLFYFRNTLVCLKKTPPDSQYFKLRKYNHIEGHMKVTSMYVYLFILLRLHYHSSMKWCFTEDYCINPYCSILCRKYGISLWADSYFYREHKKYFPFQAPVVRGCMYTQFFFFLKCENQPENRKLLF